MNKQFLWILGYLNFVKFWIYFRFHYVQIQHQAIKKFGFFNINENRQTSFIAFHFVSPHRFCVFYKSEVCGSLALSRSVSILFPLASAHFVPLCHIFITLAIFQMFSLLYLLWWSVINDFWCYYCNYFGAPWTVPI